MAKQKKNSFVLNLIAWVTGIVVSLVVGFGMINGTLGLPSWLGGSSYIGYMIVVIAGWIVVVTTLIGAVLAILQR
ncbi:MAG: hypothetical protein ABFQ65_03825 [Nanoarchaeota archaeon]